MRKFMMIAALLAAGCADDGALADGGEGVASTLQFGGLSLWTDNYSNAKGWQAHTSYWMTIQYPDLDGDGSADVCGRGISGIYCARSNGSSFGPLSLWVANYSDAFGWKSHPSYWQTIQFPDVDGDGRADVCGRGIAGIWCALSD